MLLIDNFHIQSPTLIESLSMKARKTAKMNDLNSLIHSAFTIASKNRSVEILDSHLLHAIALSKGGRREIENLNGEPGKILECLIDGLEKETKIEVGHIDIVQMSAGLFALIKEINNARKIGYSGSIEKLIIKVMIEKAKEIECLEKITVKAMNAGHLLATESMKLNVSGDQMIDEEEPSIMNDPELDDETKEFLFGLPEEFDERERAREKQVEQEEEQETTEAEAPDEHLRAVMSSIRDLTLLARQGRLDETIGRDDVMDTILGIVARRNKGNAILVGNAGVGKTAIAEGLAAKLGLREISPSLKGRPLYEVNLSELIAGTRYRGDMEARMKKLTEIAAEKNAILFIDEIHTLMGAGSSSTGAGLDVANILKPALARRGINLIGATTPSEMRQIKKDKAMMRRFEPVVVNEPTKEETRHIIDEAVGDYTLHHGVMIEDDLLDSIVDLADRYLPHKMFPDKAFDLIDLTCVIAAKAGYEVAALDHLREALYRIGGPKLGKPDKKKLLQVKGLERELKKQIFGQDHAIEDLASAARIAFMRLQPGGVAASYLLNGPSGVGKSAVARVYSKALELPMVTVSMSEFVDKSSTSRLIGAAPGYTGYQDEGILTDAGETYQEFVLLLDEVDKAHPDVFDVVMQLLDMGMIRAGDGRVVSLKGAHIFMTANLGVEESERAPIGFTTSNDADDCADEAILKQFRTEFLARVQKVIQFESLCDEGLMKIAEAQLNEIGLSLADTGIVLDVGKGVPDLVVKGTKNRQFSARSIRGEIKDKISDIIALKCLEQEDVEHLRVDVRNEKFEIEVV